MAEISKKEGLPTLQRRDTSATKDQFDEKRSHSDSPGIVDEKVVSYDNDDEPALYHNGEPVITSGKDVSRFAVDLRDDGDPALTFRSIFLGTLFAGLGAALYQVSHPLRLKSMLN